MIGKLTFIIEARTKNKSHFLTDWPIIRAQISWVIPSLSSTLHSWLHCGTAPEAKVSQPDQGQSAEEHSSGRANQQSQLKDLTSYQKLQLRCYTKGQQRNDISKHPSKDKNHFYPETYVNADVGT